MIEPGSKNGLLVLKLGTFLFLRRMGGKEGGKNESEGQSWATNLPGLTVKATVGPQFLVGLYILACILVALEPGCWGFLIVSVAARELTAGGQV